MWEYIYSLIIIEMCDFRGGTKILLSKILECDIAAQLKTHLYLNHLNLDSAHSTALKHPPQHRFCLLNILTLLSLTAAFDTNNQSILLSCLESHLTITSHVMSRQSCLTKNNNPSSTFPLRFGACPAPVHPPAL